MDHTMKDRQTVVKEKKKHIRITKDINLLRKLVKQEDTFLFPVKHS